MYHMISNFGGKLKKLMKARGIRAITLAQKMGVSCAYISQLITGIRRPGRETLLKLSKALEVPIEALLVNETDSSEILFISRRIPVINEKHLEAWGNGQDLDYPSMVATKFEYATTEDPNAFFIENKGMFTSCGIDSCDLILIEPNKEIISGNTVFVWSPNGYFIKKYIIRDDMTILMDEKQEPIIFPNDSLKEGWRFYRISQCIKKL